MGQSFLLKKYIFCQIGKLTNNGWLGFGWWPTRAHTDGDGDGDGDGLMKIAIVMEMDGPHVRDPSLGREVGGRPQYVLVARSMIFARI